MRSLTSSSLVFIFLSCEFYPLNTSILSTDSLQQGNVDYEAEPRISYLEGARDVAVLDAMLESAAKQGALVPVRKF